MGRYYYGDIEGKFWFGVQSSDSADRFGVVGSEPQYLEYWFQKEDLEQVQKELKKMEKQYGEYFKNIKQFFEDRIKQQKHHYNYIEIAEYLGTEEELAQKILKEYADYELGKKIEQSIIENGECSFTAEL